MFKVIRQCRQGKKIWNQRIQKGQEGKTLILLFPETELKILYWGLRLADSFSKMNGYEHILIVTQHQIVCKAVPILVLNKNTCVLLSTQEMEAVTHFLMKKIDTLGNCIYQNVRIISLSYQYGIEMVRMFQQKIFTPDYLVWNRMYYPQHQLADLYKCSPVLYEGSDRELRTFLSN